MCTLIVSSVNKQAGDALYCCSNYKNRSCVFPQGKPQQPSLHPKYDSHLAPRRQRGQQPGHRTAGLAAGFLVQEPPC